MLYYIQVQKVEDSDVYKIIEIGYLPKVEASGLVFEENMLQITKEQYYNLGIFYKVKIEEDSDDIVVVEKYYPKEENLESIPSEIDQLKKENEVLSDKVDNLKEALFELSLYTLKD